MKILVFAIAIFLCIGFMGCTTGKEGADTGTDSGEEDTGDSSNAGNGDADASGGGTTGQEKDFWGYLEDYSKVKYKADYIVTTSGEGESTETLTMTMYVSGKKSRADMNVEGIEARSYLLTDGMYACSKYEGTWMCYSMGPVETSNEEELEANKAKYTPVPMPSKTIAGVTAYCYQLDDVEGYVMDYCFSKEGAILWSKTSGEGYVVEMTATSYSTSVTDADFVLPAEPTDMTSYGYE